jgi:hypothetical protein
LLDTFFGKLDRSADLQPLSAQVLGGGDVHEALAILSTEARGSISNQETQLQSGR